MDAVVRSRLIMIVLLNMEEYWGSESYDRS